MSFQDWFFFSLWVVFSCFFLIGCETVNFILLGAAYFYIPKDIFELYSDTCVNYSETIRSFWILFSLSLVPLYYKSFQSAVNFAYYQAKSLVRTNTSWIMRFSVLAFGNRLYALCLYMVRIVLSNLIPSLRSFPSPMYWSLDSPECWRENHLDFPSLQPPSPWLRGLRALPEAISGLILCVSYLLLSSFSHVQCLESHFFTYFI